MQGNFYTYFEHQNEYSIASTLVKIALLLIAIYFRRELLIEYGKFFGKKNRLTFFVLYYGFIFISIFTIFVGVRGNYLMYQANSGGYEEVEGVVSGFSVEITKKKMRVESFYVNRVFFSHISPIKKKGLFGYGGGQKECTPIEDGVPVRISYVVNGKSNIIISLETTIADLC